MNEVIEYSIISRGTMIVKYGNKSIHISGELTFTPPVFYADLISIKKWDPPFEKTSITEKEKNEIVNFITNDSLKTGKAKILFD